jgi:hypothetical protein
VRTFDPGGELDRVKGGVSLEMERMEGVEPEERCGGSGEYGWRIEVYGRRIGVLSLFPVLEDADFWTGEGLARGRGNFAGGVLIGVTDGGCWCCGWN